MITMILRLPFNSRSTSPRCALYLIPSYEGENRCWLRERCPIVKSVPLSTFRADGNSNPLGTEFGNESISRDPTTSTGKVGLMHKFSGADGKPTHELLRVSRWAGTC